MVPQDGDAAEITFFHDFFSDAHGAHPWIGRK